MKILGYIHSYNDEDIIDLSLEAVLSQTHPLERLLLVDNGSTDRTLQRNFPPHVTVLRHCKNLGTSCAVKTGLQFAMAERYPWVWVLDADSIPRRDALQKLVQLYESFDHEAKRHIGVLSSIQLLYTSTHFLQGRCVTRVGMRLPEVDLSQPYYECDCTIWSGSLINLQAVDAVGFPRCGGEYWEDLSLDYGDVEFTYRIKRAGYKVLVHRFSIIDHPLGRSHEARIFGRTVINTNHPPDRRYLFSRNMVYFWLYIHPDRKVVPASLYLVIRLLINILKILLMERKPLPKILACLRGAWHGLTQNMHRQC